MFIVWSDADADWVEEIEIVSSFECKYVFDPFEGGGCHGKGGAPRMEEKKMSMHTMKGITNWFMWRWCWRPIFSKRQRDSTELNSFWLNQWPLLIKHRL